MTKSDVSTYLPPVTGNFIRAICLGGGAGDGGGGGIGRGNRNGGGAAFIGRQGPGGLVAGGSVGGGLGGSAKVSSMSTPGKTLCPLVVLSYRLLIGTNVSAVHPLCDVFLAPHKQCFVGSMVLI